MPPSGVEGLPGHARQVERGVPVLLAGGARLHRGGEGTLGSGHDGSGGSTHTMHSAGPVIVAGLQLCCSCPHLSHVKLTTT
jgi:hypothetical protein